ncbi:Oidioi.mRNA.OKI2018_I69.PAR.g9733.t1.cds [Oikopleura dioica]|uniref:non-specific serine/threonine protein kinase n=1 Tax=Oikopleura dioica TaxID=34765 RepID=A0ABN7RM15_OIKDI|nr:Oidioi.mRNA.OKI2018_I69.PAR.g9733.t1.cds [Oikopleura dioica]
MGKALSRIGSTLCGVGVTVIAGEKYIKHRQLGEGAFSYVDEIENIKDGKFYALKRIICHDSKSEKEALDEAKATQSLSSKNIIKCRSFEVVKKSPYSEVWLVLEYFDKGTLWDHYQKLKGEGKTLKFNEIVRLFRGIVEGVNAIHEAGMVHRDLKPANILLGEGNIPVICDLGSLAEATVKISTKKEAQTLEDLASERCTLPYRAPELLAVPVGESITTATDIWSVGCILYSLVYLEGPFDSVWLKGDSVHLAVQSANFDTRRLDDVSGPLKALVEQMLDQDPKYRPPADLVLRRLEEIG